MNSSRFSCSSTVLGLSSKSVAASYMLAGLPAPGGLAYRRVGVLHHLPEPRGATTYHFDHVAGLALTQIFFEQQVEVGDHRVERRPQLAGVNHRGGDAVFLKTLHPESDRHFPSHL